MHFCSNLDPKFKLLQNYASKLASHFIEHILKNTLQFAPMCNLFVHSYCFSKSSGQALSVRALHVPAMIEADVHTGNKPTKH